MRKQEFAPGHASCERHKCSASLYIASRDCGSASADRALRQAVRHQKLCLQAIDQLIAVASMRPLGSPSRWTRLAPSFATSFRGMILMQC